MLIHVMNVILTKGNYVMFTMLYSQAIVSEFILPLLNPTNIGCLLLIRDFMNDSLTKKCVYCE